MSGPKINPRSAILLLIIAFISLVRVAAAASPDFSSIANYSAVGAIAIFGGAYFSNGLKALGFPLLVLLLSDIFIANVSGYGFFYGGWYWTYVAFILMVIAARFIIKNISIPNIIAGSLVSILIHWIVSDISAMYVPGLYPPTFAGYLQCLVAAIPFELRFLYGTAIYGAIMFGSFELLKSRFPRLAIAH